MAASPLPDSYVVAGEPRDSFLRELWASRGLARELIRRDLRVRYKQAAMGCAWAVLMPILVVAAGALVRSALAFVAGRSVHVGDAAGMAVKALPWSFFVGSMTFATMSLTANANLITKTYFPREVLPLSAVATHAVDSSLAAAVVLLFLALAGVPLTVMTMVWVPVLAAFLFFFTAGAALLTSCANLFFRDVKYFVHVLLTFGIFFTPVFFEPEMFGRSGARLMMLNPLAPILEGLRLSVVGRHNLLDALIVTARGDAILAWSPWDLAYAAACALAMCAAGCIVFRRVEGRFAECV